jgi:hypothetical protein
MAGNEKMAFAERVMEKRAQRYPFRIPLYFRKGDTPDWHECKTVDMSRTGILFETDADIPVNANLEIRVQFSPTVTLQCQGSVVRTNEGACAIRMHHPQVSHLPSNLHNVK